MFVDTHCHLNFKAFDRGEGKIIKMAEANGVGAMIIPGTDVPTSSKAVDLAKAYDCVYAVVGIHPHHATQYCQDNPICNIDDDLLAIEGYISESKVVGIGEIGLDRHTYSNSRHGAQIVIDDTLFAIQQRLFIHQLRLATKYYKSIVIHNRETSTELINLIETELADEINKFANRIVLHCCEPDLRLLQFAQKYHMYIGVDGDITYIDAKQQFVESIPLDMLVLETDSPYLLPEPLRTQKRSTNVPANIPVIAAKIAEIKQISIDEVEEVTTNNAKKLFALPK